MQIRTQSLGSFQVQLSGLGANGANFPFSPNSHCTVWKPLKACRASADQLKHKVTQHRYVSSAAKAFNYSKKVSLSCLHATEDDVTRGLDVKLGFPLVTPDDSLVWKSWGKLPAMLCFFLFLDYGNSFVRRETFQKPDCCMNYTSSTLI